MSGIDVFVGNYPVIDWELYTLWVEGKQGLDITGVPPSRHIRTN